MKPIGAMRLRSAGSVALGAYATAILSQSPSGYWRMGDLSGATMADSSGNGRSGSYVGSPTLAVAGLDGSADTAVTFNGTTQAGSVPYGAWMNSASFSASCITQGTGNSQMARRGQDNSVWHWHMRGTDEIIFCSSASFALCNKTTTDLSSRFTLPSAAPTQHHGFGYAYASGVDGVLEAYINGLLYMRVNPKLTPNTTGATAGLTVNAIRNSLGNNLNEFTAGTTDEAAFWASALTGAQLKAQAAILGYSTTEPTYAASTALPAGLYAPHAINGYSGSVIDVRRSSDNATRTIGLVSGELDTADLTSWAGSDSVYVSRWYDQSGNAYHLSQATNANQPRILNAGALEVQGSSAVINFVTGTFLAETGTALIATANAFTGMVASDAASAWNRGEDGMGAGWSIDGAGRVVFTSGGAAAFTSTHLLSSGFGTKCFQATQPTASTGNILANSNGVALGVRLTTAKGTLRTSTRGVMLGRFIDGSSVPCKIGAFLVWRGTAASLPYTGEVNAIHAAWAARWGY